MVIKNDSRAAPSLASADGHLPGEAKDRTKSCSFRINRKFDLLKSCSASAESLRTIMERSGEKAMLFEVRIKHPGRINDPIANRVHCFQRSGKMVLR